MPVVINLPVATIGAGVVEVLGSVPFDDTESLLSHLTYFAYILISERIVAIGLMANGRPWCPKQN